MWWHKEDMMFDTQVVTVGLDGLTGTAVLLHVLKAPSNANGGGLQLVDAWVTNGTVTSSTISFSLQLLTYSNNGTVLSGTVAAARGGSTDHWATETPKQWTISDGKIDGDEWLVIKKTEDTSASNPTRAFATFVFVTGN
jgi:hypothetical protein